MPYQISAYSLWHVCSCLFSVSDLPVDKIHKTYILFIYFHVLLLDTVADALQCFSYAFSAWFITKLSPSGEDDLIFKKTLLDETGVYDNTTGKYTAKVDGLYIFHATLCSKATELITVNFLAGGTVVGTFRTGDENLQACSSGSATARLQKGEQVSLRGYYATSAVLITDPELWNSFSGHLISP